MDGFGSMRSEEDQRRPRVLLLSFQHAAGHNFQYVSRDAVLFAPLDCG